MLDRHFKSLGQFDAPVLYGLSLAGVDQVKTHPLKDIPRNFKGLLCLGNRMPSSQTHKIGIPKEDRAGRMRWFANNYRFFGAPVGLFMIIDRRMGHGQWAHMGMYMQTIALLAEERGWGTCMQECWARLRVELHAHFELDDNHMVYSGMAIGVPDPNDPVNDIYADRAPQSEVVEFRGF